MRRSARIWKWLAVPAALALPTLRIALWHAAPALVRVQRPRAAAREHVMAGTVLAELDPATYRSALLWAQRRMAKARVGGGIARAESTGWSTGPHLFFEIREGGRPVDPLEP